MKTEYDTNAVQFLTKHNIKMSVAFVDNSCPPFCDGKHIHGDKYRVTLARDGKRIQFCFWNSYNDAQSNRPPSEYDVLACASSDLYCPSDFEDFCAEYGYDNDRRKAEQTFKLCRAQSEWLQRIFDTEEMQADLSTIAFLTMDKGTALLLKPDRAVAFGIDVWQPVLFHHVETRSRYIRPWIVAYYKIGSDDEYGKTGIFKPSDFKSIAPVSFDGPVHKRFHDFTE